jgi:hypothetical protein
VADDCDPASPGSDGVSPYRELRPLRAAENHAKYLFTERLGDLERVQGSSF